MNTIQDMIKAIKSLQKRVDDLEATKPNPPTSGLSAEELWQLRETQAGQTVTIKRGRPRKVLEGEDVI